MTRSVRIALGSFASTALLAGLFAVEPSSAAPRQHAGVHPGEPSASAATAAAVAPAAPALTATHASSQNAPSYSLGTASFTAGHLYLAFLTLSETGGAVDATPGMVGAGTAWRQVDTGQASRSAMGLTAYHFVPDQTLSDVALQTEPLSSVHEGVQLTIVRVATDFSLATPIAQYAAGAGAAPARRFSRTLQAAPDPDSLVLGSFAHGAAEDATPNNGWTEVGGSDLGHSAPGRSAHVIYDDTSPAARAGSSWATSSLRRGIVLEVPSTSTPSPATSVVAAGDLCGDCADTANRVRDIGPDAVVTMGDLAYTNGLLTEYQQKYGGGTNPPTRWGAPEIKDITLPGYGNHDCYDVPRSTGATKQGCDDAVTYFGQDSSFGTDIPGTPGSYFTVLGDWLVVHLNSAGQVGTGAATPDEVAQQNTALQNILAADGHGCEMVLWHHPRFTSGVHGNANFVDPWYETAYANGVDVILNGHDHDYERFAPQDGNAQATADGIREFVVGTGGIALREFRTVQPNSEVRIVDKGVLSLTLRDGSYSWAFIDDLTAAVDDSGSDSCHP